MDFIVLILGLAMLIFGAEGIVRGSVSLAKHFQISLFAIGAVVVAAGTSLPELANCVRAVIMDHSDIAVGAVVGSNIANVALIMGTTTILCPILLITSNQLTQGIINILIALGIIILSWFSFSFNMIFGIISILLLVTIMFYLIKNGSIDVSEIEEQRTHNIIITVIFILVGISFLIVGANFFIKSAINIATKFEIPESIIGVSLVAFGTSLPELVVGLVAAIRKKVDFALGNVLGSNIYNILGILGISSFFGNFTIPALITNFDLYVMIGMTLFIFLFMFFSKKLSKLFGIISLLVYFSYITFLYV